MKNRQEVLDMAVEMMAQSPELEPTSALKEAARSCGIPYGNEMSDFVRWANDQLFPAEEALV
jgi:hypothetical protein